MNGEVDHTRWLVAALSCLLVACGPDDTAATPTGDDGGTGGTSSTEPSGGPTGNDPSGMDASAEGSTSGDGSEEATTEEPPAFEPYPARGIRISEVYANQGVGVPVVRDGVWVDGAGRNAALVPNRTTLFRGFWDPDEDFEPRPIMARLTIFNPDGSEELAERVFDIDGPSNPSDVDSNLFFVVPGELLPVGVRFQIELFETEYGYEDLPEPDQLAYPPQPGFLGVEDKDLALKVVVVPIRHAVNSACPEAPEVTDEELQYLGDQLYQQNPVQRVEMELRDPIDYTNSLNSFSPLLGFLADLRAQDDADPAAYYYGVVRPCDGGAEGVGGQAISIPD